MLLMDLEKYILLKFINEDNGISPSHLQKYFYFLQEDNKLNTYTFELYDYGPFTSKLYKDINELIKEGYIKNKQDYSLELSSRGEAFITVAVDQKEEIPNRDIEKVLTEYKNLELLDLCSISIKKWKT